MIDTACGTARLLDFVPEHSLPRSTLLELTGDDAKMRRPLFGTSGLQKRVAVAWGKRLDEVTCGECRMLVGQRFGIKWLAAPVALFVGRYPNAECDLYPGDLSTNALTAWREIHEHAPREARQMIAADFGWINQELAENPADKLLREAQTGLREARQFFRTESIKDTTPI